MGGKTAPTKTELPPRTLRRIAAPTHIVARPFQNALSRREGPQGLLHVCSLRHMSKANKLSLSHVVSR